jgi:hypothetical protein
VTLYAAGSAVRSFSRRSSSKRSSRFRRAGLALPARQAGVSSRQIRPVPAADEPQCPRCLEFAEELDRLHQRLAATGQFVAYSPGPNPNPEVERELRRWLAVNPRADASAGFRAGWTRLARFVKPRLHEWEARWWRMARENDRLRARLGSALREVSRLSERG